VLLAALALPSAAQARRHKKKAPPPPPAAEPAAPPPPVAKPASTEPAPTEAPSEKKEPESHGPSLTVVGVALDRQGEDEAALAAYLAEQAVRRANVQKLVPLEDLFDPDAADARAKAEADGDRALTFAKKAYFQDLDLETAAALCDKAYAAYLKSDLPRNFTKLVEASELKIAAFAADPAKADRVKAELSLLLPIDPRTELSHNLFNPDTIKVAEGIREKLKEDARLTLQVKANVPARVFVDGAFRGISPLKVEHLAPGSHFVTLVAPGFLRAQDKVNPGPEPVYEGKLEPAELTVQQGPKLKRVTQVYRSELLGPALAELGRAFKVDQVLAVASQAGAQPRVRQVDVVRERVVPPSMLDDLDAPLPADEGKAASTIDGLVTRALQNDHLLQGHRAPLAGSSGKAMQYAGYGLLGAGAVSTGLFTYFGLTAKSQESKYRTIPQTSPESGTVASSGKSDALIANVALGVAIAAVGTGVALLVLDHLHAKAAEKGEAPPPPEPGPFEERSERRHAEPAKTPTESSRPMPREEAPSGEAAHPKAAPEPEHAEPTETAHPKAAPEPEHAEPTETAHRKAPPAEPEKPAAAPSGAASHPEVTPAPENPPDAGSPRKKKKWNAPDDLGEDIQQEDW